jgi:hypothetical protein
MQKYIGTESAVSGENYRFFNTGKRVGDVQSIA